MIEHGKAAAANIITVSRMLFSLLLLFFRPALLLLRQLICFAA